MFVIAILDGNSIVNCKSRFLMKWRGTKSITELLFPVAYNILIDPPFLHAVGS